MVKERRTQKCTYSRGVFGTQSHIYDEAIFYGLKSFTIFLKKAFVTDNLLSFKYTSEAVEN